MAMYWNVLRATAARPDAPSGVMPPTRAHWSHITSPVSQARISGSSGAHRISASRTTVALVQVRTAWHRSWSPALSTVRTMPEMP
ncbi:hypothetical protein ADL01_05035 [Streptomyces sp. NRRL WC-3618]|nr:hypothetical protein ADL01_05035 [Streptomyces sp. NRRL WC-3618]